MPKQMAIRFSHPSLTAEILAELNIKNTVITYKKQPTMFDIFYNTTEAVTEFPRFQNMVRGVTGTAPEFTSAYRADLKDDLAPDTYTTLRAL